MAHASVETRARRATVIFAAAIALAIGGALALRVVVEGRDALADGDEAAAAKRPADAIAAWQTAARWYLPGAPHVGAAYERLGELARAQPEHALAAWRAVRGAARATRSLWTPHADELAAADAAIAQLSAADPSGAPAAGKDPAARLAWHRGRLAHDLRLGAGAAALAAFGIAAWLAGIGWLVRRGLDGKGRLVRRPALIGAAVAIAGIAAWAIGVYA